MFCCRKLLFELSLKVECIGTHFVFVLLYLWSEPQTPTDLMDITDFRRCPIENIVNNYSKFPEYYSFPSTPFTLAVFCHPSLERGFSIMLRLKKKNSSIITIFPMNQVLIYLSSLEQLRRVVRNPIIHFPISRPVNLFNPRTASILIA